jgi:Amt family ammonium transporter
MLTWMKRLVAGSAVALAIGAAGVMVTSPAHADEAKKPAVTAPAAAPAAAAPAAPALVPNKGDTAWMLVSTALVLLMTLPGLALFYGGLTRSKNILSICMQCFMVFSVITVLWALYGYSFAFTEGGAFIGGLDRLFLAGMTPDSVAATFSKGVVIPEYVFMAFQAVFATITCCLIIGSFAERAKFSAILVFMIIWFTFSYLPIAHMVWFWPGPDDIKDAASLEAITARAGW